jgi:hypothetical protein
MGLLDKAKSAAESATSKAKEGIGDVQVKRELGQAYDELGKVAYDLADAGQIAHERLDELVARIRNLKDKSESAPESE